MKSYNAENTIGELVRLAETNFIAGGGTQKSKYVTEDLYEDINRIYAYLDSAHISGKTDSQGREKPFFNIVTAARNIWYRATDIDRKNIEVTASKQEHIVPAFLASVHLQNWMRKENYGSFLNDLGLELAGFNSAVVKHVEAGGRLTPMVVPWSRLIVDPINFDANPKIEILELTEAELYQRKGYDKDMVEKLCDALQARELTDKTKQDQRNKYIKLYEVHGNLPLSLVTGKDKDQDEFVQQMHVISFVESKQKGEYDDFTLISGREERDPYMLTSLLPAADGSISLNGSVKNLFEAQWMMNHGKKAEKDLLDISKIMFQTADANFVGRNVLNAIEQGDILIHAPQMPLSQLNNSPNNLLVAHQSFTQHWKALASEINGVSESMLGNAAPSGTAWRQVEALLNESHSLFDLMTENKALCIEKMLRTYVIPFLKKQMDTSDEISATLAAHNITKIDAMYVPAEAARRFNRQAVSQTIEALETGDLSQVPAAFDPNQAQAEVRQELAPLGNTRFFSPKDVDTKTWKQVLKDLEWNLQVDITGEAHDKNTVLTTLSTALQAVANPLYANNPQAQLIVSKIMAATNVISPLEISAMPPPQPLPPEQLAA